MVEDLKFDKLKSKDQFQFFKYLYETGTEDFEAMGYSLDSLKKLVRKNKLLFGIPLKIMAKQTQMYTVKRNGELVGGFSLSHNPQSKLYFLGNFFTRPDLQGKGIGNEMLKKLIEKYEFSQIRLVVNEKNERAIHLYKKYGFNQKTIIEQYICQIPLEMKAIPEKYIARSAEKSDNHKIGRIIKEVPGMEDLKINLKKSINKSKKRLFRMKYAYSAVLCKNDEIHGVGFAVWNKNAKNTAQLFIKAVLPEAKSAYSGFFSYITHEIKKYGIEKIVFVRNFQVEHFFDEIEPYLGEPSKRELVMLKPAK